MSCMFRSSVFLVLLITAIGCGRSTRPPGWRAGELADALEGGGSGGEGSGSGFIGHQSRPLLGFVDGDVRLAKLQEVLDQPHVTSAGELVATGVSGDDVVGVTFETSRPDESDKAMRIAGVFPPSQPGARWQYALERQDPATGAWQPACVEPPPLIPPSVPPVSPARAYAMNGAWDRDGMYLVGADNISFACTSAAVGKCIEWGYAPEATPPSVTEHGLPTTATGADLLQACSRMARADFCMAGVPNTLDGTPIHYDDVFRTPPPSPDGSPFRFEAAWPGVAMTSPPAQRPPPICLSKLRWSTLPLGGGCGVELPDPRTDIKGQFCENMTAQQLEQAGALVYSSSMYLDAGLYSYTAPSSMMTLTTASLQPGPIGDLPTWKVPPPPGLIFPVAGEGVTFEATIFSLQLPPEMSHLGLITLTSYLCGGNNLVTTTTPQPGCTVIADEGKVWPPHTPGHTPLRRWTDGVGGNSRTTAAPPSTMRNLQMAEVVGGALRAVFDLNIRWSVLGGATAVVDLRSRTGKWFNNCFASGSSSGLFSYTGICPSTGMRLERADIASIRVNYETAGGITSATAAYDGVDTDVYVVVPGGRTTAVAMTWNEVTPGTRYELWTQRSGTWRLCADDHTLANSISHVFTGACPRQGLTLNLQSFQGLRICVAGQTRCGEQPYDGIQSRVAIQL